MRFWYVNNNRERIFDRASLALFFAVIVAVLIWLFPKQDVFTKQLPADQVDAVSIAYLELLLKTVPEDTSLRINLIRQLIQTGQYQRALLRLNYLLVSYPQDYVNTIDLLQLRILAQLTFRDDIDAAKKSAYRTSINQLLARLRGQDFSNAEREAIATIALAIGQPRYAAEQYVYLASNDAAQSARWWQLAAKWYLAAGETQKVARIYVDLAKHQPKIYAKKAIDTYLMLGQRERALQLYSRFLGSLFNDMELLSGATRLAIDVGDKPRARQYLRHMLQTQRGDAAAMLQTRDHALALGDLEIASSAAQQHLRIKPKDWRQREKLAQIYEWRGMPQQALDQWRKVIAQHPSAANLAHTRYLAAALYDFDTVQAILETTGKQRRFAPDELSLAISTFEQRGEPAAGIAYLQRYIERQPQQRAAWRGIAYLQQRMQKIEEALATWRGIEQRFGLSSNESQTVAGLLWSLGDSAGALQVLQASMADAAEDDEPYWRMLAQLAWQEEEDRLALQALSKVIKSPDEVSQYEADILLLTGNESATELRLKVAQQSWRRFHQPHYLLAQMHLAQTLQRWDVLEQALNEAEAYAHLFTDLIQYWLLRASFAAANGQIERASSAYQQALQLSGDSSDVVQAFLWFLLNSNQADKLSLYLRKWQTLARQDATLWQVYAAAANKLGRHSEALGWYGRLVEEDADDLAVLAAFADTLDAAGRAPAAWRLRKHVYAQLQQQQQPAGGGRLIDQLNLTYALAGYRPAYAYLQQAQLQHAWQQWLPLLTDQLIAGGDIDAVNFWRMWSLRHHQAQDLPVLQRVALAQHNHDRAAMQQLLPHAASMPAIHASSLQRLGHAQDALAVSLQELAPAAGDRTALRQLAAQLGSERPSGLRVGWLRDELGGIDLTGPQLSWAHSFDNWHAQLDLQQGDYSSDALADVATLGEETVLQWRWSLPTRHGSWSLAPLASLRDDHNLFGFKAEIERRWDARLHTTVAAGYRTLPDVTPALRAFGAHDYADVSAHYAFSARDTVSTRFGLNRFQTRDGNSSVARGFDTGLSYSHRLNFSAPEWAITAGIEWQKNNLDARLPDEISARFGAASTDLLPEEFGQVFLGTTLQRGEPHALNARTASPRYVFNAGVAYQWPLAEVSYSVSLGIGWRILGNDELALTYGYSSKPLGGQGEAAQDVRLSYSYRYGR